MRTNYDSMLKACFYALVLLYSFIRVFWWEGFFFLGESHIFNSICQFWKKGRGADCRIGSISVWGPDFFALGKGLRFPFSHLQRIKGERVLCTVWSLKCRKSLHLLIKSSIVGGIVRTWNRVWWIDKFLSQSEFTKICLCEGPTRMAIVCLFEYHMFKWTLRLH